MDGDTSDTFLTLIVILQINAIVYRVSEYLYLRAKEYQVRAKNIKATENRRLRRAREMQRREQEEQEEEEEERRFEEEELLEQEREEYEWQLEGQKADEGDDPFC